MKLTFEREEILKKLQIVGPGISSKSSLPVLSNLLLKTQDQEKVEISGTDLEIAIKTLSSAKIEEQGAITIPAQKFLDIVRESDQKQIHLQTSSNNAKIKITSGKTVYNLNTFPEEDFPQLPALKPAKSIDISGKVFANMIKKTIFAVSTEETRYVLCGLYFDYIVSEPCALKIIGTDGKRMAYISTIVENGPKSSFSAIVPTKAVKQLETIISGYEGLVNINIEENQIAFKMNDTILISRLIEGDYPNYEQVIPRETPIIIKVKTKDLSEATRRVAIVTTAHSNSIIYKLKNEKLTINAVAPEVGDAQDEISVENEKQQVIETAYNPNYLLEALKNIEEEQILLKLIAPLSPGVITPVGGENYINVIMPMRT